MSPARTVAVMATRPLGVEDALPIEALVGVRAEEVALTLDQVRGHARAPERIEVRERRRHRREADPELHAELDRLPPVLDARLDRLREVLVEQQIGEVRVA